MQRRKQILELYLIRHGQSTNNRGDARVPDPPLTDIGRQQANIAGQALRNLGITRLYCSAMLRALQTAAIVGNHLELAPHIFVDIHEWGGVWEDQVDGGMTQLPGLTRAQLRDVCPSVVLPNDVTENGWWFPALGADQSGSTWDYTHMAQFVHKNCLGFIEHLDQHHAGTDEKVGAIIHGGSGSILLGALLGMPPPDKSPERFSHNNTGISKIRRTSENTHILYQNQTSHLLEKSEFNLEASSPLVTW